MYYLYLLDEPFGIYVWYFQGWPCLLKYFSQINKVMNSNQNICDTEAFLL
jgi:hypothetical protein